MTDNSHIIPNHADPYSPRTDMACKDIPQHVLLFCLLSLLLHLCILAGGIGFSLIQPPPPLISDVVQVDLVSPDSGPGPGSPLPQEPVQPLPAPMEGPEEPEPAEPNISTQDPAEAEPEPINPEVSSEPEPVIRPDISLKSKPKDLKKLLEKAEPPKPVPTKKPAKKLQEKPDAEKILTQARKRLENRLNAQEQKNQSKIAQALKRMSQKVQQGGQTTGTGSGRGTGTGKTNDALALYKMVVSSAIRQNWIFNEAMTRINQGLEVRIRIKILQSGEIRDIIYEKRSGNHYLDDSAKKAIQRANPLPSLPNGMKSYDVGVIFTPKGLQ